MLGNLVLFKKKKYLSKQPGTITFNKKWIEMLDFGIHHKENQGNSSNCMSIHYFSSYQQQPKETDFYLNKQTFSDLGSDQVKKVL